MTTIPAVMAALAALANATLNTDIWQAINGPSTSVTTTKNHLVTIGGEDEGVGGTRELNSMGVDTTEEQYLVPVVISADLAGTDQLLADDAVLDAYEAYEQAIREYPAGPNLGLAASGVLKALPTGDFRLMRRATGETRSAAVRFYVSVYAQNT
jgi:hypothetical protein